MAPGSVQDSDDVDCVDDNNAFAAAAEPRLLLGSSSLVLVGELLTPHDGQVPLCSLGCTNQGSCTGAR